MCVLSECCHAGCPCRSVTIVIGWRMDGSCAWRIDLERKKGIRWMPWHQEAMKDVARCEKPWGAASRL